MHIIHYIEYNAYNKMQRILCLYVLGAKVHPLHDSIQEKPKHIPACIFFKVFFLQMDGWSDGSSRDIFMCNVNMCALLKCSLYCIYFLCLVCILFWLRKHLLSWRLHNTSVILDENNLILMIAITNSFDIFLYKNNVFTFHQLCPDITLQLFSSPKHPSLSPLSGYFNG